MPKTDHSVFESLGAMLRPPPPPAAVRDTTWHPRLNPTQKTLFDSAKRFILTWGEKGCRTGDAQIYVDGGLARLQRMMPQNAEPGFNHIRRDLVAFDGDFLVRSSARAFWVESDREAFRCELANGAEITGSPRHPLWLCAMTPAGEHHFGYFKFSDINDKIAHGWRFWTPLLAHPNWNGAKLSVIAVSHRLARCRICGKKTVSRGFCAEHYYRFVQKNEENHPLREEKKIPITESLAYAIGALVGDGSLNIAHDDRSVAFANIDPECVRKVNAGLKEIGCHLRAQADGQSFLVLPASRIKPVVRALELATTSYFKRIPDQILESPKPVVAAFLAGLFDTDGTVDKAGSVSLTTTSEKLGRDVQDCLAAFGILAVRRPRKSASGRPTWTLSLFGRYARQFGQEIGFSITRKQARIRAPEPTFRCPLGTSRNRYGFPEPIKNVWRSAWRDAKISKTRKECYRLKRLCSFGSIPSWEKVQEVIATFGSESRFRPFLLSDCWLELTKMTACEAELFDLHVPGHSSFLASGTINHNSGKSIGCLEKLVKHCYENDNALAIILVRVRSMANKGGAWDKLQSAVLPVWKAGLGLDYSEVKFDSQHNEFIWIQNQYGGWSMVVLISAPHANQLRERIRGYEPSYVFVDELTSCDSPEYFQAVAAQIGRRPFVDGMQQFVAACNPEGPSHWVYQKWFVQAFNEETGEWDPDFENIYFPIAENEANLPPGYLPSLKKIYRDDKVEGARMIGGQWVERPSGEGLFRDIYNPIIHVRPLDDESMPNPREWLKPDKTHPIIIGLDPGSVYNAFIFEQWLPLDQKMKWFIFDEIVITKQRVTYDVLIPMVMRRVKHWRDDAGGTAETMPQVWISDLSAFNQYIASQGSFDVMEIERIYEANRARYGLEPLKIRAAPKFNGSKVTRVRLFQKALGSDEVVINSRCVKVQQMCLQLEGKKFRPGEMPDPEAAMTPQRSDHLHVFDGVTYPIITASLNPTALNPRSNSTQQLITAA